MTAWSREVEGPYPDYRRVLPEPGGNRLRVDREVMLVLLKRPYRHVPMTKDNLRLGFVLIEVNDTAPSARLTGPVGVDADEPIEPADYVGEPMKVLFAIERLMALLEHLPNQVVNLHPTGQLGPMVVEPDWPRTGYRFYIMPIRQD